MAKKVHLLKRWLILKSDRSAFLNQLTADLLWAPARVFPKIQKARIRIKKTIYEKHRFFLRFGSCRYVCRAPDIDTLLEMHKEKVYSKNPDFTPKEGDVVVDVGANIGEYSVFAAQKAGDTGKVIAFEPNKDAVMLFEQNIALNRLKNTRIIQKPASESKRKVKIYGYAGTNIADSMLPVSPAYYTAEATTMDSELKNEKKIDLIKMDIEGGEFRALLGAAETLRKKPRIILELHQHKIRKKTLKLLEKAGYEIVYEEVMNPLGCWIIYLQSRKS